MSLVPLVVIRIPFSLSIQVCANRSGIPSSEFARKFEQIYCVTPHLAPCTYTLIYTLRFQSAKFVMTSIAVLGRVRV